MNYNGNFLSSPSKIHSPFVSISISTSRLASSSSTSSFFATTSFGTKSNMWWNYGACNGVAASFDGISTVKISNYYQEGEYKLVLRSLQQPAIVSSATQM